MRPWYLLLTKPSELAMGVQLLLPTLHQNLFWSLWVSPEWHRTVTEPWSCPWMSWVVFGTVASVGREQDRDCQHTEPPKPALSFWL